MLHNIRPHISTLHALVVTSSMSTSSPRIDPREQEKKVALITGSSSGIGANIAIDLANSGYLVVVTGRTIEKLNEVVEQCKSKTSILTYVADLSRFEQVDQLVEFVRHKFNRLDVLINNLCYRGVMRNILDDGSYDDLEKVMHLNLHLPMYLSRKCFPLLKNSSSEKAIMIFITSTASQVVVPLHLYNISKACLAELSRQMALCTDFLSFSVAPGPVLTKERPFHSKLDKFTLMKRVGTTQEISNLLKFSIEHPRLFHGKEILIDGGYMARQKQ